ncbi:MAG: ABC transporter ATP-binding protein [Armatimonadetes bacterium]|nr:ABC transporter ATP-binding protein [Armatimonadota bacterium]
MATQPTSSSSEGYIALQGVTKVYQRPDGPVHALRNVSLTISRGELVGLQGPSGSGKSTLLNLLGGLDRPTEGRVVVDASDISKLSSDALALYRREKVGFVFQDARLLPALTVYENVMLPLVPIAMPETAKRERVEQALEQCNIGHRASHLPGELSGGEQQRASVARAIVNDPALVLADEPTGELDPENAELILQLLRSFAEQGRTVVVASHNAPILASLPRRLKLRDGEIEEDGE